jgi:hypothetical protein
VPLVEPSSEFLDGLWEQAKARVADMAGQFAPDKADTRKLTPDDISMLWNTRAMPLEKEWELWRAVKPDGSPMYTREEIGKLVFPEREKLALRGGRIEPKSQISWVNAEAKRQEAKRLAQAPPPDPMMTAPTMAPEQGVTSLPAEEAGYVQPDPPA